MKVKKIFMEMAWILILICCAYINCKAEETTVAVDEAHFPDENFRKYITENIDKDKNGVLSSKEISKVKSIDILNETNENYLKPNKYKLYSEINIKGIEYFTNLHDVLICSKKINNLNSIVQNKRLNWIRIYCGKINFAELPPIKSLRQLEIYADDMEAIDLSKYSNLCFLTLSSKSNRVLHINCKKNKKLIEISINSGAKKKTRLDFSNNKDLMKIELNICYSKIIYPQKNDIENLNINMRQLNQKMQIKGLKRLKTLRLKFANKDKIRKLKISNCPKLKTIIVKGKGKLHTLNFTQMKKLQSVYVEFGKSLRQIHFSKTPNVKDIGISGINIKKMNINSLKKLDYIDVDHCGLKKVDLRNLKQLEELMWNYSKCETMLFKNNKKLEQVEITHNRIKGTLNLSDMSSLWNFYCDHNKIAEIYASKKLKDFNNLSCEYNKLKKINLYHTYVERIYAKHNPRLKVAYLNAWGGVLYHFDKGVKKHYKEKW